MTNVFAVLFQVAAALLVLRAAGPERPAVGAAGAAGLALGLALSTRWTSFLAAAFLALVWLAMRGRRAARPRELALFALAWLVLPALVYVASYVPWMAQRHDLATPAGLAAGLGDLWPEQVRIWRYHADLRDDHPYFSPWYTWPWLTRPTWYYFQQAGGVVRGILAVGNPLLWWAAVPVTLWALIAGTRRRDPRLLFTGTGFCAMYLPWALSPRTLNFAHYLFEAIPYACLSLGLLLDSHWHGRWRIPARAYLGVTLAVFLALLPLLTALGVRSVPLLFW
jgi:dolichyl-phosphate-mannose--protein O-mannosyl transferase